jgi:LCP family protein required for cell wall assembly
MPERRRRSRFSSATATLSIGVLVLSLVSWVTFDHVTSSITREEVFKGIKVRPDRSAGSSVNYLLVGSDTREGLTKQQLHDLRVGSVATSAGKRSDTAILIHISKNRDHATIISIPRDTYADVPEWTDSKGVVHSAHHSKINATFGQGGAPLLIATIENMTQIRIDHYVEVNFAGFANLVDAVGGVDVCTTTAIHDKKSHIDLTAGKHHLDGITALKYVRARYFDGMGDLGRMKRQQKFIASMISATTSTGTLLNPVKLLSVINAGLATVTTDPDLQKDDLVTLATQMKSLSSSNLNMLTVPFSDENYSNDGVYGAVLWDPDLAPKLWQRIKDDIPVAPAPKVVKTGGALTMPPANIVVEVQNGTSINGLAAKASQDLTAAGFVNGAPPSTALTTVKLTTITYDPTYADSLRTLKAALPNALTVEKKNLGKKFIVTLGPEYKSIAKFTAPKSAPIPTPTETSPFDVRTGTDTSCK